MGVKASPARAALNRQEFQLLLDESEETGAGRAGAGPHPVAGDGLRRDRRRPGDAAAHRDRGRRAGHDGARRDRGRAPEGLHAHPRLPRRPRPGRRHRPPVRPVPRAQPRPAGRRPAAAGRLRARGEALRRAAARDARPPPGRSRSSSTSTAAPPGWSRIEDLVEELVGDIRGEEEAATAAIRPLEGGRHAVEARRASSTSTRRWRSTCPRATTRPWPGCSSSASGGSRTRADRCRWGRSGSRSWPPMRAASAPWPSAAPGNRTAFARHRRLF